MESRTSLGDRLRAVIMSEPAAWAVQNMVGVFVATLFMTVPAMRFPLGCMVAVIVPAVLLCINPDRSVGGRLFATALMGAASLGGATLGGIVVTLSFLGRGSGEPFYGELPPELQKAGAFPQGTAAQLKGLLAQKGTGADLPPALLSKLSLVEANLEGWLDRATYGAGFWTLMIVLSAVAFVPLALGRAYGPGMQGVAAMLVAMMAGNVVVFGVYAQLYTLELFWREMVLGFVYAGLGTALCSVAAGCFLCVRSAHDEARYAAGAILLAGGAHISRLASALLEQRDGEPAAAKNGGAKAGGGASDGERFRLHLAQLTGEMTEGAKGSGGCDAGFGGGAPAARELGEPSAAARVEFQKQWARLKRSLAMAAFEPPVPGLCSQPGASVALYGHLQSELELFGGAMFALAAACTRGSLEELSGAAVPGAASGTDPFARVRGALAAALATAAAACAHCGQALDRMPLGQPCSGPALAWRPLGPARWAALRADLVGGAAALADFYNEGRAEQGLDFAMGVDAIESHSLMSILPAAIQLLFRMEAVEASAAAALGVPAPAAAATEPPSGDVEKGGKGAVNGDDGSATAAVPPAPPSLAQRSKPFVANATTLLAMLSSAAAWIWIAKACATACRGLPAVLSSRAGLRSALGRPAPRYAFKWWLGNSLAMMGSLLFLWKGPSKETLGGEMTQFTNWLPLYFTMAACLLMLPNVEGSADRAVLRPLGIAIGGLLGLAAGCNGRLLNNPYYFTGVILLGNAVFSFPAAVPEFRYSLAMACYTFTGILACTYLGCCGAVVTWQAMAAKAVPTALGALFAMALTALLWPAYASNAMLAQQAGILRETFRQLCSQHKEIVEAARERRAPALGPQFAGLSAQVAGITAVGAQMGTAQLDPRQHPLLSLALPLPPVVPLTQARLRSLTGHAWASLCTVARPAWPAVGAAVQPGTQPEATSLAAGDYFRIMAEHKGLEASLDTMMAAQQALVDACAENLEQGRRPEGVAQLRERVASALSAASDARLAFHLEYERDIRPELLRQLEGTPCLLPDLVFSGWLASFCSCLDELLVMGCTLSSPPAQQRDWFGSWLTAWRRTRAQV